MGFLRATAASLGLLTVLCAGEVRATALETDVDVSMPSLLALSCYDSVDVNVTADALVAALRHTPGTAQLSRDARGRPGRLIVNAPRRTFRRGQWRASRFANLKLSNICSYRAIGQSRRGVLVSVAAKENVLKNANGSQIRVRRVRARDTENAGNYRRRYRVRSTDLGWTTLRGIDVEVRLDFRNAKTEGTYTSDTDGTFGVTVVLSP